MQDECFFFYFFKSSGEAKEDDFFFLFFDVIDSLVVSRSGGFPIGWFSLFIYFYIFFY